MSDERTTDLKTNCVALDIRFRPIADEFEVRFLAYLNDAVNVFCSMCPAYYRYFSARHSRNPRSAKPPILKIMTETFEVISFAFAIHPILQEVKVLDKSLQSYSLFPDQACELLDKFKDKIESESLKEMSNAQRTFYSDYDLQGFVPAGRVNKQYSICGVSIKNYSSGHKQARIQCRKLKTVILEELSRRFPPRKQQSSEVYE